MCRPAAARNEIKIDDCISVFPLVLSLSTRLFVTTFQCFHLDEMSNSSRQIPNASYVPTAQKHAWAITQDQQKT